jgi:hypothetical protein
VGREGKAGTERRENGGKRSIETERLKKGERRGEEGGDRGIRERWMCNFEEEEEGRGEGVGGRNRRSRQADFHRH